jgi:NitT/TauT family transport system substrate-binding protein
MKKLLAIALFAALASGAQAEPLKIRMQYGSASGQYVPILPLVPKEIYKHYGKSYVVEPHSMAGAGPALTALAAGELDLAGLGPQTISTAVVTAKLDLRAIVQVLSSDVPGWNKNEFWAKPPITKVEDLRGKIIAVNSRNSATDAALHVAMKRLGMQDNVDYQLAEMRFPAILPALETGRVHAGFLIQPFSIMAAEKGYKPIFSTGDAFGPNETVTWTGQAEWIAKNRAVLVDFVEDHILFRRWALDPKTRMEAVKLVAQVDKTSPDALAGWLYTTKDNYRHPEGLIDVARFQKNVNDLADAGVAPGKIDATKYVDTSIVKEAAARLGKGS